MDVTAPTIGDLISVLHFVAPETPITLDLDDPAPTLDEIVEMLTQGSDHIIRCFACGSRLHSRPGWALQHHGDGSHSAVFWGTPQQPPSQGSTCVPLPEVSAP